MTEITIRDDYQTRASLLPVIRANRMHMFKRIAGIEPESEEFQHFEFTTTQFLTAALLYQTNIFCVLQFTDIVMQNESLLVFVSLLIIHALVSIPLLILFIFMSSYCKKGFLRFWDCVPMFAGLGYSMLLCRLTYAVFHVYFTSVCFLLIADLLRNPNILQSVKDCSRSKHFFCQSMYPTKPINKSCPTPFGYRSKNETVYMATQFYYRFEVIGYVRHTVSGVELRPVFVLIALLIWFIVFAVSIFGVQRIRKLLLNTQLVLNCCGIFAVLYAMLFSNDPIKATSGKGQLYSIDFWVKMLIHSTDSVGVSDVIYMATLKPNSLSPIEAGLLLGIAKILYFMLILFCTQYCTHSVLGHYKFTDAKCLLPVGHDVIFAFVPDVLYRIRFGTSIVAIWYITIFCTNVNMLVFTVIAIVSALTEKFQKLNKYRLLVYAAVCLFGFLGSLYFCTNLSLNTIYAYRNGGDILYVTVCLITFNLALMFVYSTKRIVEDYAFTYGNPPKKVWIAAWQTVPIIALFVFVLIMYQFQNERKIFIAFGALAWSYVHCTIIIIPIFSQLLAKCFKHVKYRTLNTVTKPSEKWGPYNPVKRQTRKFFYPQRDVRYRNYMLTCQHRCIANSGKYYEEDSKQTAKMRAKVAQMELESRISLTDVNE